MHGGLAEWCVDLYQKDFYSKFPLDRPTLEPVLVPGAVRFSHVARGGSWIDPPEKCRSAARRFSEKDWLRRDPQRPQSIWWLTEAEFVGFRVVCPVEELESLKGLRSKVTRESQ
jgi:formylglycine-generating enzyme required for sulfatase activity